MLRYKEIKRQLLDLAGNMPPGEKLPSRLSLCKKLDTNRRTLDKAIGELCVEGVFYSVKERGAFINALVKKIVCIQEN